jgi:hypothetical protein
MTRGSQDHLVRRVLLGALAVRESFELGPMRFKSLAKLVASAMDADDVAYQLSAWEDAGLISGASSLQDGLPEPVYVITPAGRVEWDRLRGAER